MQLIKSREEQIAEIRLLAIEFAKSKQDEYTAKFLNQSHLSEELYAIYEREQFKNGRSIMLKQEYFNHLITDYKEALGQIISLSYALGAIDSMDKIPAKLYRPSKTKLERPQE